MSEVANRQYRLLSGPYKLAIWAVMCRLKTRLIGDTVHDFHNQASDTLQRARLDQAIQVLEQCKKQFDDTRQVYTKNLCVYLERLMKETSGVELRLEDRDLIELSNLRVRQIEDYLSRIITLWKAVSIGDENYEDLLFRAISESIWPYYGVAYKSPPLEPTPGMSDYKFATWLINANLLSVPFVSRIRPTTPTLAHLCLYPSVITDGPHMSGTPTIEILGSGRDRRLVDILGRSSDAFLEFDNTENVVGMVQQLPIEILRKTFDIRKLIKDSLTGVIPPTQTALFTDLFYFVDEGARLVIGETDSSAAGKDEDDDLVTPIGALFLGGPSIRAFCRLLDSGNGTFEGPDEEALYRALTRAWDAIGGNAFARELYYDTEDWRRRQFDDLTQFIERERIKDFTHNAKTVVNDIRGLIDGAMLPGSGDFREYLWNASQITDFIAHQFALEEQTHVIQIDSMLKELGTETIGELAVLVIKYQIAFRQLMDRDYRSYYLNDYPLSSQAPSAILAEIRNKLDYAMQNAPDDLIKNPIFASLFMVFHEIIHNMRPRREEIKGPKGRLSRRGSASHRPSVVAWHTATSIQHNQHELRITFLQRVSSEQTGGSPPFENVMESASLIRLNRRHRYGPAGLNIRPTLEIKPEEPRKDGKLHTFALEVVMRKLETQ